MQIVVPETFETQGDLFGAIMIKVPSGAYRFFRETKLGYLYTCEGVEFEATERGLGGGKKTKFHGGILLYNRANEVRLVQIFATVDSVGANAGELPRYFVGKEIDANGFAIGLRGPPLASGLRGMLGL